MKRFRLSTLMLLVVIAALGLGLIVQEMGHRRREAELESTNFSLQNSNSDMNYSMQYEITRTKALVDELNAIKKTDR